VHTHTHPQASALLNFLTWTQISTTAQQVASELGYSVTPEAVRGLILVTMANITCNGKAVRCIPLVFCSKPHLLASHLATNTDLQSGWMSSEWRHLLEQWTVPGQQMCLQFWLHGDILRFTCQQLHIRCRYHRRSRARYLPPFCVSVHPVPRLAQLTWYPLYVAHYQAPCWARSPCVACYVYSPSSLLPPYSLPEGREEAIPGTPVLAAVR